MEKGSQLEWAIRLWHNSEFGPPFSLDSSSCSNCCFCSGSSCVESLLQLRSGHRSRGYGDTAFA